MNNDEKEKLIGKTIKDIKEGVEGLVIFFTDKTIQEVRSEHYPDSTYAGSNLNEENDIIDKIPPKKFYEEE